MKNVKCGSFEEAKSIMSNDPILELCNEWVKYTSSSSSRLARSRSNLSNERIFLDNQYQGCANQYR